MFGVNPIPTNGDFIDPSMQGGLVNSSTQNNVMANPMFMAGLGLLSAGRDRRIDPFQQITQGLLASNQIKQQQADADMQRQMFGMKKAQFDQQQAQYQRTQDTQAQIKARLDAGDQEGAAKIAISSGDPQWTAWGSNIITPKRPAQLQEYDAYKLMSPEERAQYKDFTQIGRKDTTPYFTPIQTSGGFQTFDNRTGHIVPLMDNAGKPLLPIAADVGLAGNKSAAETAGKETAKNAVDARSDLPRIEMNADNTLRLLDNLQNHPGRDYATGIYSLAPTIPGTKQADFLSMLDQLNGQSFLQAFQALKGGGQITEIEGKKATDAIQRIKRSQTKEGFDQGVQELRQMINDAREISRKKAGSGTQQPTAPTNNTGWGIQEIK